MSLKRRRCECGSTRWWWSESLLFLFLFLFFFSSDKRQMTVLMHSLRTLQSMFPNLDHEVIEDVVRAQEGNVGRAVDACLALSSTT